MLAMGWATCGAQSLEECREAAQRNYPLIKQYGLIEQTTELTLSNIHKGWLPQMTASAQATLQSDVVSWPEQMRGMYQQLGLDMKGLKKDQYRVGLDVQQTVYDGGTISSQKEVTRRQADVQQAQTDVSLYQIRSRVDEMYFGLLLLDEQIALNSDLQELLAANERKLNSMFEHGTAAQSDYLSVKAERLSVAQQATSLQAQRRALARLLSAFCSLEVTNVVKPAMPATSEVGSTNRPELRVIDARLRLADARERALDAALRPRLTAFAQGYYGYPGYNMFEDMVSHRWSWNAMIGVKLSWNIGALYTRKNDKAALQLQRSMAETDRDVFLFNNNLEQMQHSDNIARHRQLMADDEQIIALRSQVRKAAESKLAHGIIDVNDLLREINSENAARLQQSLHEIEMLKEAYAWQVAYGM